jgi:allantoinase
MGSPRAPGMDHQHYAFSPLQRRPRLTWPGGAALAVFVTVHLEHWELQPPAEAHRDPRHVGEYGSFFPDYRTWTQRAYGNRVGVFRILDLLEKHAIRATVAVGAEVARRHPELVARFTARGDEIVAHGTHATRMITSAMNEAQERAHIAEARDALTALGMLPRGWSGQDRGESARTPQLLAETGFDYVIDWPNDDQPFEMATRPAIVSVPSQAEWDDVELLWLRRVPMPRYPALVGEAAERLHAEGGRVFGLSLHPWLAGMPHRVGYVDAALSRVLALPSLWQATAGEIAAHYRATSSASTSSVDFTRP